MVDTAAMERVAQDVRGCTACRLHEGRTNAVPGEGAGVDGAGQQRLAVSGTPFSGVVCVGEAPGRNEDETGRPFCGAAGKNLDLALREAGLDREHVFITSIIKCRPPNNRDPKPDEKAACIPWLEQQIGALRPKVLVALGRHGLSSLVDEVPKRFTDVRGRFVEGRHGVPVWVSLHPAAVIYRQVWKQQYLDDWRRFGEWVRTGVMPPEAPSDGPV